MDRSSKGSAEHFCAHALMLKIHTIAPACADRSGGPPKPGAAYENQPDGAAGGPPGSRRTGPDGAPEGLWGRHGVPRVSEHQSCTNTGQSSDPSDDYMLRAALECTFFWRKQTYLKKGFICWVYCNSPNGSAHSNCTAILCRGMWSMPKVTLRVPKFSVRGHPG